MQPANDTPARTRQDAAAAMLRAQVAERRGTRRLIAVTLLLGALVGFGFAIPVFSDDGYKDTEGYKAYLKLPESYRTPEAEAMYREAYVAEKKVRNLPSINGGTVEKLLDEKAAIPAVEDLGWVTSPYDGGFEVERILLLGDMELIYRWIIDASGLVKATNSNSISITTQ